MTYELKLLERVSEVPREEWDALVGEDDSPFVEWTWLDALETSGCVGRGTGWAPCHVALRDGSGALVAAAPMYLKSNSEGEFVFDYAWADLADRIGLPYYPKLIVAVPFTPATGARVLTRPGPDRATILGAIARALRDIAPKISASSVHTLFPVAEQAQAFASAGYVERYGIQFHWRNRGYTNVEDFLRELPSKKRTQLRREMRQPERDGVVIETLAEDGYTPDTVREMFELYRSTVEKFHWGRQYLNLDFFEKVAESFRPRLSWVVARREGQIIAGAFNVKKGKRLYGRYWGAKTDLPFLHFNVCYYHGIRQCIEQGIEVFEPGAGGEHKRVRGFEPTLTHSVHWIVENRMRRILEAHLARERAVVMQHVESDEASSDHDG
ncbi:GNAT family N-acetyltransferase [Pendulispora albinea]|uniref:GNAT family N-acetyltransferase n=1 Tax=Pendulispora albinea TaxID=2741071 RepID=A0ABZ2M5Z9_9BACT